ncbi:FtsX-like permease family protein [Dehalobacterium formicoaceticum]|uniref:ABC transporter permease n=1 Tax=Dehalobacterium formicoaceticum TaxID=51515 RepID=A0ABT1Y3C2_9FIRM|nr:FtsX-like permease family protein [Dehalobacterium formicoaceticum]MCR6544181.1 ABC transporter permease [Dehalobacterium formicoaceticum]
MNILLRFIVKSMLEKKLRTALIIFAVTISASLFFASSSISDNLIEIYMQRVMQTSGNAEILIKPGEDSPAPFVNVNAAEKVRNQTEYIIKGIDRRVNHRLGPKQYDSMNLWGLDLEDYKNLHDLVIIEEKNLRPFTNNKIIISQATAQAYQLKPGDEMEFFINGVRRKFQVAAIAAPAGLFLNESGATYGIAPFDTVSQYVDTGGKPNVIFVKGKDPAQVSALTQELAKHYPRYEVAPPFTEKQFAAQAGVIATPLMLVTVMISFMSIFIIYSSFKVITLQKIPLLGTFRSVGASKKVVHQVMLLESLIYGFLGGILSCVLGVVVLYFLTVTAIPSEMRGLIPVTMHVSPLRMFFTFILANVICFASTLLPIMRVANIPLKEIILNQVSSPVKSKPRRMLLGWVLLFLSILLPFVVPSFLALPGTLAAMFCAFYGMVQVLPQVLQGSTLILGKPFALVFGNMGGLALRNLKGDKSILNSVTLITIGIAILLMVNTVSVNMVTELIDTVGRTMIYDIKVSLPQMGKNHVSVITRNPNVSEVYPIYQTYEVEIEEYQDKISMIDGVNGTDYREYIQVRYLGDQQAMFQKLQEGRNIILTTTFQKRHGLVPGDRMALHLPKGEKEYTVIGFMETMLNAGGFALIGDRYAKMDLAENYFSGVYVNLKAGGDPAAVREELKKALKEDQPEVETTEEFKLAFQKSNQQLMNMLTGFTLVALLIGTVGVVNNLMISFIERKHSIAVFKSVGMSRKQVIIMILAEALCQGLIGGGAGILLGSILVGTMPLSLEVMKMAMPMRHMPDIFHWYLAGAILITVAASLLPALQSSKLQVIQAVKYE